MLLTWALSIQFSSAWHDEERSRTVRELLAATGEAFAGRIAVWVE